MRDFHHILKDILWSHKLDIIGLMEPKLLGNYANVIYSRIGFNEWIQGEVVGFSGGIWIFWNKSLNVDMLYTRH